MPAYTIQFSAVNFFKCDSWFCSLDFFLTTADIELLLPCFEEMEFLNKIKYALAWEEKKEIILTVLGIPMKIEILYCAYILTINDILKKTNTNNNNKKTNYTTQEHKSKQGKTTFG